MQRRGRSVSCVAPQLLRLDSDSPATTPHSFWHLCHCLLTAGELDTLAGVLQVLGELYISQGEGAHSTFGGILGPLHRRGTELQILCETDKLHLKLASVLSFAKEVDKLPAPLSFYSGLLCALLREFRPALLALAVRSSFDCVLEDCAALLKQDKAHTALLMVVEHISSLRDASSQSKSLKEVLLPLAILLKGTGEAPQLEVVARVEHLISLPEIQTVLRDTKSQAVTDIPSISSPDFPLFLTREGEVFAHLGNALKYQKKSSVLSLRTRKTLLRRRCNSQTSHTGNECPYRQESVRLLFPADCIHSPAPTPYFPQLSEVYEESLRDSVSEAPARLPSPHLLPSVELPSPVAAVSGDDVIIEPSEVEGPFEHPHMSDFLEILRLEKEPDTRPTWELVCSRPNVNVYKKRADDTPVCMIKAYCVLDHPPEVVFTAMVDVSVRVRWDKLFSELEAFDPQPYHDYLYYVVKTPIGISRRDWVQKRTFIRDFPEPGSITLYFISENHPMKPIRKGIVRALTLIAGQILRPMEGGKCSLTMISQNDIGGLVPTVLVNHGAARAPAKWVHRLNKGCRLVEQ